MANPLVVPGLIAGGASLIGGILANRAQRSAAREQMAFQERMSNTSYQRAVSDMRMSGINPMLAYAQGGASSPGGAQPNQQDVIGPAVSSAMHARRLSAELMNMQAQNKLIAAQTDDAKMSAESHWMGAQRQKAEINALGFEVFPNRFWHLMPYKDANLPLSARHLAQGLQIGAQDLEHGRLQLPQMRNRANMEGTAFAKYAAYVEKLRESLLGGGGFFLGPRVGGAGRTTVNRTYNFRR